MQIIHDIHALAEKLQDGTIICIGNFDGIHLGHKELLLQTLQRASKTKLPSLVISFDPHPQNFFSPYSIPLLMTNEEKAEGLEQMGVDFFVPLPFTTSLAALSPEEFVKTILCETLHCKELFVGHDYKFGKERAGGEEVLTSLAKQYGFTVTRIAPYKVGNIIVSSSKIRELLLAGDVKQAEALLGRPYSLRGLIVHGKGRGGKLLGFPTANMTINKEKLVPEAAVYAGKACILEEERLKQLLNVVISIGTNPTFNDGVISIEVHILDFSDDLYDSRMLVFFEDKLRGQTRFDNLDSLIWQISEDIKIARTLFQEQ